MPGKHGQVSRPNLVDMKIRLPAPLRERIEAACEATGASMNGEIVARLETSFAAADGLGQTHLRPALMLIAHDAWRVEQHTGKKWTEDRVTAHAIAELAGDSFRYSTPFLNQSEINTASEELKAWKNKMEGRIAYLKDVGAITELKDPPYRAGMGGVLQNALAGIAVSRPKPPEGWEDAVEAIKSFGWEVAVDLTANAYDWPLARDGQEIAREEKIGALAILRSFGDFREESETIVLAAEEAWKPERAAKKEAKALVSKLRAGADGP